MVLIIFFSVLFCRREYFCEGWYNNFKMICPNPQPPRQGKDLSSGLTSYELVAPLAHVPVVPVVHQPRQLVALLYRQLPSRSSGRAQCRLPVGQCHMIYKGQQSLSDCINVINELSYLQYYIHNISSSSHIIK